MNRVLLGAILALAICAAPAAALPVGYNEDPARLLAAPQAVEHSNTQLARVAVQWQQLEPVQGEFHFHELDRLTRMLKGDGIRPIIFILGSPHWAGPDNPGIQCSCDRAADPAWQAMWRRVARRYPEAILNVWNEPNLYLYGSVSVARMAELTNLAAEAIWNVSPKRTVLGPPIAPSTGWEAYAGALYPLLDRRIDMAANIYPRGYLFENLRHDLTTVKRIADGRRVWITETNVSRLDVSGVRQTRYINRAYDILSRRDYIAGILFHRLWSPYSPDGVGAWDRGLSALTRSGTPRRMYETIGRLHRGFRPLHGLATFEQDSGGPTAEIPYHFPTIQVCPYG